MRLWLSHQTHARAGGCGDSGGEPCLEEPSSEGHSENQQGGKKEEKKEEEKEEEMWHAPMQVAEEAGKAYPRTKKQPIPLQARQPARKHSVTFAFIRNFDVDAHIDACLHGCMLT